MWEFTLEVLSYPFMRWALLVALFIAVSCGLLSCFLVLKGWALMADAISHAILVGVALANVLGLPLMLGAFAAGLSCASLTAWLERRSSLKSDSLLGISFSFLFALGVAFGPGGKHLTHLLLGNLLGLAPTQSGQIMLVATLIIVVLLLKWRDLMLFVFDPVQSQLAGQNLRRLSNLLLVLLTLITVAALQAVGVILVVALLIGPGLCGQLLARSFAGLMGWAVLVSLLSTVAGLLLSVHLNSSPGATIVLCQSLLFLCCLALRKMRLVLRA